MLCISVDDFDKIDAIMKSNIGIDPRFLEKDLLTTRAISFINDALREEVILKFCGGGSLLKRGIIERMSQDSDFKFSLWENVSKSQGRKIRKELKTALENSFRNSPFAEFDIRARNENHYFRFEIPYRSRFPAWTAMAPFIKLEFVDFQSFVEPETKKIFSLVDKELGIDENSFEMPCQPVREIAGEKVLAILRRLTDDRPYYSENPYLLRHIYDVAMIVSSGVSPDKELVSLFRRKIKSESDAFATHCSDFADNPSRILRKSLEKLKSNPEFRTLYQDSVLPLIFRKENADYDHCLKIFSKFAEKLVSGLDAKHPRNLRP